MPDGIKDAVLIYNPTSGRKRHRRFVEIEQAARLLKDDGIATEIAPTQGPNSATQIARQAVEQRRGMVIACGGDGTINEIINGLAGSQVPMALLPAQFVGLNPSCSQRAAFRAVRDAAVLLLLQHSVSWTAAFPTLVVLRSF